MVNKVILQGRLTANPEMKVTASGVSSVSFTVAWSKKIKEVETKCFLRCKAWRERAEMIYRYFVKGQEIVVEGSLETEEWTAGDGQKRSATVLTVSDVHFCGKREARETSPASSEPVTHPEPLTAAPAAANGDIPISFRPMDVENDDLPF